MPNQINKGFAGKTLRSLITITADDKGNLPTDISILPVGLWNTEFYGPMQVTPEICNQMVANFKAGVRRAVPIDVDHDGGKAAGWIKDLISMGSDGLHAIVDWTKYGEELLNDKLYKLFSPEWSFSYVDPEYGTAHGAVLIAGSLTNRPLFKELPFLVASDNMGKSTKDLTNDKTIVILLGSDVKAQDTMDITTILAKPKADRTEEEVKFLSDNVTDLSEDQKKQLDEEAKPTDPNADADADKAKAEAEAKAKADQEAADAKAKADADAAAGGTENVQASELARLRKIEADHKVATEELRRTATEKEVKEKFVAAEDGMRVIPAQVNAVVDFALKCNEEQKKAFYAILASVKPTQPTKEEGDASRGSGLTASEQINKLVAEKMKADDKLSKTSAYKQVIAENPKLMEQSAEEDKAK